MKKRILSALAAAAVLMCSAGSISAADTVELSERASIEIDSESGYIKGIVGTANADFIASQFKGEAVITSPAGAVLTGDAAVPSDSVIKIGDSEAAKVLVPGDANRDGKINITDVSLMLKYIAGWDVSICEAAADFDGSSKTNIADVSTLLKYIAEWDVTLSERIYIPVFSEGITEYKLLSEDEETASAAAESIKALTGSDVEIITEAAEGQKFIAIGKNLYEKYGFIDKTAVEGLSDTEAYIDTYGGNIYLTANSDNGILGCLNYITAQAFTPELDMNIGKGYAGVLGDLETLITPEFDTLEIEGLTNSYRFLHVTDSHITTIYEDEENEDRRNNVAGRLNDWIMNMYRKPSYLFLGEFFNYAENIDADALLLTGDITDSPSLSNTDILKNAVMGCSVPSYYIYGNHDWTWNDNYQLTDYRHLYRARFKEAVSYYDPDWDDYFNCIEYPDLMIVSVDNSAYKFGRAAYMGLKDSLERAKAENKPVILMLHIPIHTDDMHPLVVEDWGDGGGLCMGEGGTCTMDEYTTNACNLITAEDSPIAAIFAGHVHFSYETMVAGRIPQYVTASALDGHCRVVDIVPAS